ncbi:MAG: WxcM-like domain-containing protein [Acetobacteraceae bacterium]|nr:WxcM-like domain-containing protein [Acetobacteraceae bacterium]
MSELSPAIDPQAICRTEAVGAGSRIGPFARVLEGARLGRECEIGPGALVDKGVRLGDRVTVSPGAQLWAGTRLEDDVVIGPNTVLANERFPRRETNGAILVRQHASVGANVTILPGVEIGTGAVVGAGAVVTRSVPPNAVVTGNPARITRYVNTGALPQPPEAGAPPRVEKPGAVPLGVGRASLHELRLVKDLRGALSVGEFEREIPFTPKRYFIVFDVPSREARGEHAHKVCDQFLICVRGSCSVLLDDGRNRREVRLDRLDLGVYMPAGIWGTQYRYTADAALLVFASHYYDANDYIRTYDEYLQFIAHG